MTHASVVANTTLQAPIRPVVVPNTTAMNAYTVVPARALWTTVRRTKDHPRWPRTWTDCRRNAATVSDARRWWVVRAAPRYAGIHVATHTTNPPVVHTGSVAAHRVGTHATHTARHTVSALCSGTNTRPTSTWPTNGTVWAIVDVRVRGAKGTVTSSDRTYTTAPNAKTVCSHPYSVDGTTVRRAAVRAANVVQGLGGGGGGGDENEEEASDRRVHC